MYLTAHALELPTDIKQQGKIFTNVIRKYIDYTQTQVFVLTNTSVV